MKHSLAARGKTPEHVAARQRIRMGVQQRVQQGHTIGYNLNLPARYRLARCTTVADRDGDEARWTSHHLVPLGRLAPNGLAERSLLPGRYQPDQHGGHMFSL